MPNLPARIQSEVLCEQGESGKHDFPNRQLRLEERCPEIRIVPSGRGRFRLELHAEVALADRP